MKHYLVEKTFEYKGFQCAVILQQLGHRCGYVNVAGTRLENVDYEDINYLCVHGGLTYSSHNLVEHNDGWWIGWDYGHCYDGQDYDAVIKNLCENEADIELIFMQKRFSYIEEDAHLYTTDEVAEECKKIVDQIIELGLDKL